MMRASAHRLRQAAQLCVIVLFAFVLLPPAAVAEPTDLLMALKRGGHALVFRHGATHPHQADTDPLNPDNVKEQRHLNDRGRAVAKATGAKLGALGVPITEVHTSLFRRAVETAELMGVGTVTPTLDLTEGGLVVSPIENARRAAAFRALCGRELPAGGNRLIVSHKPSIIDAFGEDWFDVQEGEASVFKVEAGKCTLVTRIRADEWEARLR
jgi:broad specificity phosphatase PhoE